MLVTGIRAGQRIYYCHPAPLVTAPKMSDPWRPAPLRIVLDVRTVSPDEALLRRVIAGLRGL